MFCFSVSAQLYGTAFHLLGLARGIEPAGNTGGETRWELQAVADQKPGSTMAVYTLDSHRIRVGPNLGSQNPGSKKGQHLALPEA